MGLRVRVDHDFGANHHLQNFTSLFLLDMNILIVFAVINCLMVEESGSAFIIINYTVARSRFTYLILHDILILIVIAAISCFRLVGMDEVAEKSTQLRDH